MESEQQSSPGVPRPAAKLSLRQRLLLTLTLALCPTLLFAGYQSWITANESRDARRQSLVVESQEAVDRVQQSLVGAEMLLQAYTPEILAGDCLGVYERLNPVIPFLSNVARFDRDGLATCASLTRSTVSITNPKWHETLREGRRTVRSEAFFGPVSKTWLFAVLRRVDDERGVFDGSVSFSMRTEALADLLASDLPKGAELALSDDEGKVFRSQRFRSLPKERIQEALDGPSTRLARAEGFDGRKYDVVVRPLGATGVYAVASMPAPGFLSEASLTPLRSFGVPILAFSFTLLAAWLAVDNLVLKWLSRLQRRAAAYGAGHYRFRDARTVEDSPREIADLAFGLNIMAERISERDVSLRKALKAQEDAMREIHHRVKNNLQIVTSFLSLQARQLRDPEARQALAAARHRIDALSIVHQTLYQHDQLDTVQLKPFLEGLLEHLSGALGLDDAGIGIRWSITPAEVRSDDAIPMALFVVEAVTNSMKYGFADRTGEIAVTLERTDAGFRLKIADNGRGADLSDPAVTASQGLGTRLMNAFAKQLRGGMSVASEPEGGFRVVLDIDRPQAAPGTP